MRGVNQFDHFIRFDEDETLTDTNEFMYSITQRLFHRTGDGQADELVSWKIAQKYYFDPTFNGALVPGTRNVFQALDSITPFAFADEPRHFSPIDSDLRITPGGAYDAEVRLDYDTVRHKITHGRHAAETSALSKFQFYRGAFFHRQLRRSAAARESNPRPGRIWRHEPPRVECRGRIQL